MVPVLFFILTALFFRSYFLKNQVPLPFNLLVSFYAPWRYETWAGYGAGVPNKPLGYDNLKLFYPYRKFTTEELSRGKMPLWNPYVFAGNVHHATYQSAVFYPLNVIYHVLPLVDAWSLMVMIQPVLAGWFTYLFLRSLNRSQGASWLGALGFAYSGWMIAMWEEVLVIVHTILWLPLALYASNLIWMRNQTFKGIAVLIFALSLAVFAGFPQMTVYFFGIVIAWNIYHVLSSSVTEERRKKFVAMIFAVASTVLLTAVQWVPASEAYVLAPRAKVDSSFLFNKFFSPLTHLLTFLAPDFWGSPGTYNYFANAIYIQERTLFVGLVIFLFAFFAFVKDKERTAVFWKASTLLTLSLGFAFPTSWVWHIFRVPVLSVAQPLRILILPVFGLCVLASYGIDTFQKERSLNVMRRILQIVVIIFVGLWIFTFASYVLHVQQASMIKACNTPMLHRWYCSWFTDPDVQKRIALYGAVSIRNLVIPTITLLVMIGVVVYLRRQPFWFITGLSVITLGSSMYFAQKMLYFSDRQFEYPLVSPVNKLKELAGYDRVWSYGDGYIVRNILSYYRIFSAEGYEALYAHRYGVLLHTIQNSGRVSDRIQRNDATLSETGQFERMTHNPIRLRLMSLLGVKYVLEHTDPHADQTLAPLERFPPDLFTLAWENDIWRIWEYKRSLPRAFVVHTIVVEKDPQKIVDILIDENTDLLTTAIVEDEKITLSQIESASVDTVEIVDYQPTSLDIRVNISADGLLFLSDTYYPGWKAFVDDIEARIYRTNYTFRGVLVPKGSHTVRFVYQPQSFTMGVSASIIGVIMFLGLIIYARRNLASQGGPLRS